MVGGCCCCYCFKYLPSPDAQQRLRFTILFNIATWADILASGLGLWFRTLTLCGHIFYVDRMPLDTVVFRMKLKWPIRKWSWHWLAQILWSFCSLDGCQRWSIESTGVFPNFQTTTMVSNYGNRNMNSRTCFRLCVGFSRSKHKYTIENIDGAVSHKYIVM